MTRRRIVITGAGVICSIGQSIADFWENLVHGRSGVGELTLFDASEFSTRIASEVRGFDPTKWMDKRLSHRLDRFAQVGMAAAIEAIQDSGLDFSKEDRTRVGVLIGSGIGGLGEIEAQHKRLLDKGPSRISPFLVPKLMANACSGQVSIKYALTGPNSTSVTACASAAHSFSDALRIIRDDAADIMVAGGCEAAITPLGVGGFCALKALSTRNDEPEKASRPFDKDRDGFVVGEGAGILVLEEYEHAKTRGARIYGEFLGTGLSSDGVHITRPDPEGKGAARSMKHALEDARLNPEVISYISAHGTSTSLNDVMETKAIKLAFGDRAAQTPVTSMKSMIGHLLGASAGVELVGCLLSLQHGIIPPTINYETPDPECDLDYVPNEAREADVVNVMKNSFGFGGHNATVIIGKMRPVT